MTISFELARSVPRSAAAVGVPVYTDGSVPRSIGLGRAALSAAGFEGKVGQTFVVISNDGPAVIAVGMGPASDVTTASLRKSAAALARAADKRASLASSMADVMGVDAKAAAQAVVEGIVMASYRFTAVRANPPLSSLERVTLLGDSSRHRAMTAGIDRGSAIGEAVCLARDLINLPPAMLTAPMLADRAVEIASSNGLGVEVWENGRLIDERCNGLVRVNAGSHDGARLVKLTYSPRHPTGTVALVGKGITFDSGGLSLKPSDGMKDMKMDMSGAAAVLAAMSVLRVVRPKVAVVGYLCCTDNLPSSTAQKVSDVITYRNGTTVEVLNTDAEGRLVLADALVLAVEEQVDAIVDLATLTGACMAALGLKYAGLMGSSDALTAQLLAAAGRADEGMWPLPLPAEYRKLLDSEVADLKNIGGPYAGAITAGLFLKEFTGSVPWAHIDMAGPMRSEADEEWRTKGGTGFGVRTFLEWLERVDIAALRR
jgi:leucyl aminopeptidase